MATKKQFMLVEVEMEEIDTPIVPQEFKDAIFESLIPDVVNVRVIEIVKPHLKHFVDVLLADS